MQNTRAAHYLYPIVSRPRSVNKAKKCQTAKSDFPLLNITMQYGIIRYIVKIRKLHTRCLLLCFYIKSYINTPYAVFFKNSSLNNPLLKNDLFVMNFPSKKRHIKHFCKKNSLMCKKNKNT